MSFRDRLSRELSPNTDEQRVRRAKVVATLFLVLQSDRVTEDEAKVRMAFWLRILADRPAMAIETAADWWTGRKYLVDGENRAFAPRPAELLRLADEAIEQFQFKLAAIEQVLSAEVSQGNEGYITKSG